LSESFLYNSICGELFIGPDEHLSGSPTFDHELKEGVISEWNSILRLFKQYFLACQTSRLQLFQSVINVQMDGVDLLSRQIFEGTVCGDHGSFDKVSFVFSDQMLYTFGGLHQTIVLVKQTFEEGLGLFQGRKVNLFVIQIPFIITVKLILRIHIVGGFVKNDLQVGEGLKEFRILFEFFAHELFFRHFTGIFLSFLREGKSTHLSQHKYVVSGAFAARGN